MDKIDLFQPRQTAIFYQIFALSMLTERPRTLDKRCCAAYNEHCSY